MFNYSYLITHVTQKKRRKRKGEKRKPATTKKAVKRFGRD